MITTKTVTPDYGHPYHNVYLGKVLIGRTSRRLSDDKITVSIHIPVAKETGKTFALESEAIRYIEGKIFEFIQLAGLEPKKDSPLHNRRKRDRRREPNIPTCSLEKRAGHDRRAIVSTLECVALLQTPEGDGQ